MSRVQNHHYNNLRRIFGKYMRTLGKESHDIWLMSGVDHKKIAGTFHLSFHNKLLATHVHYSGHQFVLGACSSYFDSIFNELNEAFAEESAGTDKPKMILVMRGCSSKTLEKLIDFMYKGPDELRDDSEDKNWKNLYALGEEFEVHGLLESIVERRKMKKDENENVTNENGHQQNIINYSTTEETLENESDGIELCSNTNVNLIDLDECLTNIAAGTTSNKAKWIERAESKLGLVHKLLL